MAHFRLFLLSLWLVGRDHRELALENLALRQQLAAYERRGRPADRRSWSGLARTWPGWRQHLVLVQRDTVVRWHRTAWRVYWRRKSRARRPGRPRLDPATIALIQRLRRENPIWGTRRIQGELLQLGLTVSRTTVQRYAGIPAPSPSWRTFVRLHAHAIWACDFFTVPTLTFRTLYVFFVIAHDRRTILHWNVTRHPTADWVWQQIREATPWGQQPRDLIRDRDSKFGGQFTQRMRRMDRADRDAVPGSASQRHRGARGRSFAPRMP